MGLTLLKSFSSPLYQPWGEDSVALALVAAWSCSRRGTTLKGQGHPVLIALESSVRAEMKQSKETKRELDAEVWTSNRGILF